MKHPRLFLFVILCVCLFLPALAVTGNGFSSGFGHVREPKRDPKQKERTDLDLQALIEEKLARDARKAKAKENLIAERTMLLRKGSGIKDSKVAVVARAPPETTEEYGAMCGAGAGAGAGAHAALRDSFGGAAGLKVDATDDTGREASIELLALSIGKFALSIVNALYRTVVKEQPGLFISPFSIFSSLIFLLLGGSPEARNEIELALDIKDFSTNSVLLALSELTQHLSINFANAIFYNSEAFKIKPSFMEHVKIMKDITLYVEEFDVDPVAQMNRWVDEQTMHFIPEAFKEPIPESVLSLVLVNAIYFKGKWHPHNLFERNTETPLQFLKENGDLIEATQMQLKNNYFYAAYISLDSIEMGFYLYILDYENSIDSTQKAETAAFIIVPYDTTKASDLLRRLPGEDLIDSLKSSDIQKRNYRFTMPMFTKDADYNLEEVLPSMDIKSIFKPGGLTNMVDGNGVNSMKHTANVKLDDIGTTAAGVTRIAMAKSLFFNSNVVINRSFIFGIYDKTTKVILFIGLVDNPDRFESRK